MEINSINSILKQNEIEKELGYLSPTLQRYRYATKNAKSLKIKQSQKISKDIK